MRRNRILPDVRIEHSLMVFQSNEGQVNECVSDSIRARMRESEAIMTHIQLVVGGVKVWSEVSAGCVKRTMIPSTIKPGE